MPSTQPNRGFDVGGNCFINIKQDCRSPLRSCSSPAFFQLTVYWFSSGSIFLFTYYQRCFFHTLIGTDSLSNAYKTLAFLMIVIIIDQ